MPKNTDRDPDKIELAAQDLLMFSETLSNESGCYQSLIIKRFIELWNETGRKYEHADR